jgi:hypothetical protein
MDNLKEENSQQLESNKKSMKKEITRIFPQKLLIHQDLVLKWSY